MFQGRNKQQQQKKDIKKIYLWQITKIIYFLLWCYDKAYLLYLEEKILIAGGKDLEFSSRK